MDGILLINKPVGITSNDVIQKVKEKLKIRKIGHCGTLDPFASGLLVVLINNATKLQSQFLYEDKTYSGEVVFGKSYDTLDITGEIREEDDKLITFEMANEAVVNFPSKYLQTPPQYSAVKIEGRRAYEYARAKRKVEIPPREVNVYNFKLLEETNVNTFSFKIKVSSGTYIRKIAEDLAHKLNTFGALKTLHRVSSGKFNVKNAVELDDLDFNDIVSTDLYFDNYLKLEVSDYIKHLVKNGVYLDERQIKTEENFIVVDSMGEKLAYYIHIGDYRYKPIYFFNNSKGEN